MDEEQRCARHADTAATIVCERCGDFACSECSTPRGELVLCRACAARDPQRFFWETSGYAVIPGYVMTLWGCLGHPRRTFADRITSNTLRALAFGVMTVVLATLLNDVGHMHPTVVLREVAGQMVETAGQPRWLSLLTMSLYYFVGAFGHVCGWTLAMYFVTRRNLTLSLGFRYACYCLAPLVLFVVLIRLPTEGLLATPIVATYLALYGIALRTCFPANRWLIAIASIFGSYAGAMGFLLAALWCLPWAARVFAK